MSSSTTPTSTGRLRHPRRLFALATATALAGGLAATPSSAAAAVDCYSAEAMNATSASSVGVVVGTTKAKTMKLNVTTLPGCSDFVVAAIDDPRGAKRVVLDKVGVTPGGSDHWQAALSIKPESLENSDAGSWPILYTVLFGEVAHRVRIDAQVQRAARISFNAGPEPIRDNRITYSGKLERANWDTGRYAGWPDHRVHVEAYEPEHHDYEPVTTLVTNGKGNYRATRRYRGDGQYQSHSSPSISTQMAQSRVDTVAAAR